jgi:hypothetical protein
VQDAEIVTRPPRKDDFAIYFATRQAKKGWRDLIAVRRSDAVNAWDLLARSPLSPSSLSYPLSGSLAEVVYRGQTHQRWQLKPSATHGARIWYFVEKQNVYLEKVHTAHPNSTKR